MFLCVRVDLDYVPWDTPDAADFGHGEPAVLLRLLDLGKTTGYKFHFFISNRVLRAFPATAEAVLNDGHDLDWFCKHPEVASDRQKEAEGLFEAIGHRAVGFAIRGAWQSTFDSLDLSPFRFCSASPGIAPPGVKLFPVGTRPDREAVRNNLSARSWSDGLRGQIRESASRNLGLTIVVRPQVLAKFDARLSYLREVMDLATAVGLANRTLRELTG